MSSRGWLRRDDKSLLANIDVEAIMEREALIKAGGRVSSSEVTKSEPTGSAVNAQVYVIFYGYGWSDSAATPARDPFEDEQSLRAIYAEFAEEEISLANEGLADFYRLVIENDGE